jgi:hypothetical protein
MKDKDSPASTFHRSGRTWPGRARLCRAVACLFLLPSFFLIQSAPAQIQQAWVARYNNGITNGTNQAVNLVLDSAGNIYVTGFSQNSNMQLGYVTIKYAPNGTQLWASRYDSTNYPGAAPKAMALDISNNIVLTGSAMTIKYDSNGNPLWTAPYAGTALAIDRDANIYVAGFSQNFGTAKLSPEGSNVWVETYVESYGPTVSQSVLVDSSNNVYVSGLDSYYSFYDNGLLYGPYVYLTTIKYDSNGNQLWKTSEAPGPLATSMHVEGAVLDNLGSLYLAAFFDPENAYWIYKYGNSGNAEAFIEPDPNAGPNFVYGMTLDSVGNMIIAGQQGYLGPNNSYGTAAYGTFKADTNGSWLWTNLYPMSGPYPPSSALALAVDSGNNAYVTGYSPVADGTNNIVTIKYGPNGNQLWLQQYNALNAGNDAGTAIAVDKSGNVYVTGYEALPAGGTGIVTIKYWPVSLQRRSDGTVILQAQGTPGESFDIEASEDLLHWLDLGSVLADTNGLMQFDDTNAPAYPARFYYTTPQ